MVSIYELYMYVCDILVIVCVIIWDDMYLCMDMSYNYIFISYLIYSIVLCLF